jgi:phosphoglycerate kinase
MGSISFRSVDDAEVAGKRVLLRVDLNVPMIDGAVTDATRIERVLPTIRLLLDRRAKVIVLSHYGRPKGKRVPEMSLRPVAEELERLLDDVPVRFLDDCIGPEGEEAARSLGDGEILFLENLRFHAGEEANDPKFVEELKKLGDLYVNEGFSVSHRAHASVDGLARALPAYAGRLMAAEVNALSRVLDHPERPEAAVVGGAKVSTKIDVLNNLVQKFDAIIVGGGMANTFLHAQGIDVGKSLCEKDLADTARKILEAAVKSGCEILLPQDAVVADSLDWGVDHEVRPIDNIPDDMMILDVGPETLKALTAKLENMKTLLWNGPLGAFEVAPFGAGTFHLAREAARLTRDGGLVSVAGGGDTVAALNQAGVGHAFTYVSTAGGAFLEWLEGKELPGVAALAA